MTPITHYIQCPEARVCLDGLVLAMVIFDDFMEAEHTDTEERHPVTVKHRKNRVRVIGAGVGHEIKSPTCLRRGRAGFEVRPLAGSPLS